MARQTFESPAFADDDAPLDPTSTDAPVDPTSTDAPVDPTSTEEPAPESTPAG